MNACEWFLQSSLTKSYHDKEWGTPVHSDKKMFEFMLMESMSCGLSWTLMLKKRDVFKKCFANFDWKKVAKFSEEDVGRILETPGMIRSESKVRAVISNAKVFIDVAKEFGTFCKYLWSFTNGKALVYRRHAHTLETRNELSDRIAKDLKRRGFKYMGSVTLYSHLQGVGIINDHAPSCPRFAELLQMTETEILE